MTQTWTFTARPSRSVFVGGPLENRAIEVPEQFAVIDTPQGQYRLVARSDAIRVFAFMPQPAKVTKADRWARQPRRNPFTTPKRRGNIFPSKA